MSMDPDGTNRIIQQQIKEWHGFREGERAAKLLQKAPRPPMRQHSVGALARRVASAMASPLAAFRGRPHEPLV